MKPVLPVTNAFILEYRYCVQRFLIGDYLSFPRLKSFANCGTKTVPPIATAK